MTENNLLRRCWLPTLLTYALFVSSVGAQGPIGTGPMGTGPPPPHGYGRPALQPPAAQAQWTGAPYRLADRPARSQQAVQSQISAAKPGEHPLMPVLLWARDSLKNAQKVQDYSATMVKRERLNGKVGGYEYMFLKVRHKPFSVYMYVLDPPALKGREVLYVKGRNNGKLWAHGTGWQKTFGTVSLSPTGRIAMQGQLYPISEIGFLNLVSRLVEIGEKDSKYGECEVKFYKGAKVQDRTCTCIEVIHPVPRRNFLFHIARIFVDDELNLVIRYASYDWPKTPGAAPELLEEYSYLNLKLNNGFNDADFDTRNPNYHFN